MALISLVIFLLPLVAAAPQPNDWTGSWFPFAPGGAEDTIHIRRKGELITNTLNSRIAMGDKDANCDNGQHDLSLDYDPKNISHHIIHICLQNRTLFVPNRSVQPVLLEYVIPPEYSALHKCTNETIEYDYRLPTFGTHRPVWPVYGEYVYVPPQRWIHNLEHGAIVALYHPCANQDQLLEFHTIIKKCLYRHIITASDRLEPERPFALVSWGKSFEFSVVDQSLIIGFIRMNALHGTEKIYRDGQYNATLIEQAAIVSSNDDELLCPNM